MFPTNRAHHDQDSDAPINHGTCARSVRAGAAEHLSGDSPPRQPGRMPHRTLTHELLLRPGLLALAVVALLGGIVVDPAAATSQDMGARQALLPPSPAAGSPQLAVLPTQAIQADPAGDDPRVIPEPVVERLELEPAEAWILPGASQDYTAEGFADGNRPVGDVIARTEVTITRPGECPRDQLGKVSCTASEIGDYGVSATLTQEGRDPITAKAVL